MIKRAERLKLFQFYARERDCPVCKDWPHAERPSRRLATDYFPLVKLYIRCTMEFFVGFHRYWALHPPKHRRRQ
jgi:hypothetical protein